MTNAMSDPELHPGTTPPRNQFFLLQKILFVQEENYEYFL